MVQCLYDIVLSSFNDMIERNYYWKTKYKICMKGLDLLNII